MGDARRRRAHCAYCAQPRTSDDHVPPKNIFSGDRTNLITVPSCDLHNNRRSALDEEFRDYVAMRIGSNTPTTQTLWDSMLRRVQRNPKIQNKIRQNSIWRPDLNAFLIPIEASSFKPMIERITQGLYWHVSQGDRLPLDVPMQINEVRIDDWILDFVADMDARLIGQDQFYYAYKRMDEHPAVSIWIYVFHRKLGVMVMTDILLRDRLIAASKIS